MSQPERMPAGMSEVEQAARLAKRSRGAVVIVLLLVAVAFGVARARDAGSLRLKPLVPPAHALGPNQGESLGKATAPVLVEEYGDFRCPPCAAFEQEAGPTLRRLAAQGTIHFVFHPVSFTGTDSYRAAAAATCAGDEGKFWPFHDRLYSSAQQGVSGTSGGAFSKANLIALGRQLGLDDQRFTTCVQHGTYEPWARKITVDATRRGVSGAPVLFVNGKTSTDYLTLNGLLPAIQAAAHS